MAQNQFTNIFYRHEVSYKFCHTGSLEVFDSVLDKYCPKRLHLTLDGMIARTQSAVSEYNCGSSHTQATTKYGKHRHKQILSKVTLKLGCVKNYLKQKIKNTYINYLPH